MSTLLLVMESAKRATPAAPGRIVAAAWLPVSVRPSAGGARGSLADRDAGTRIPGPLREAASAVGASATSARNRRRLRVPHRIGNPVGLCDRYRHKVLGLEGQPISQYNVRPAVSPAGRRIARRCHPAWRRLAVS